MLNNHHSRFNSAAVVIHAEEETQAAEWRLSLHLAEKTVTVISENRGDYFEATMNQGVPIFGVCPDAEWQKRYCEALQLSIEDLHPQYPMQIVSTGLPYLLVPVRSGLARARIQGTNLEELLSVHGARFVYVFDPDMLEGRTWDNRGRVEDVATGSAAGPVGAYLFAHGWKADTLTLHQGRFVGRPSELTVSRTPEGEILVSGAVVLLASGTLRDWEV